jgi:hypothetical protein
MTIADILVYADPTAPAERLDLASRLAHRFQSYLIGVVPGTRLPPEAKGSKKMLQNEAIPGEWHMAIGLAESYVTRRARCADLVILESASRTTRLDWTVRRM